MSLKTHVYTIDDRRVRVKFLNVGAETWVHVDGQTWLVNNLPKGEKAKKAGAKSHQSGEILAPMPGKILRINIKAGDQVKKDDVLVVMEAMKMEYSLQSEADGLIQNLNCKENEQVELGKILVNIKYD